MKAYKHIVQRKYYKQMTQTFTPSADLQTFTVPATTTKLEVDCVASSGYPLTAPGGDGGRVQCVLPVTPNSTLYFMVGDIPQSATVAEYNASDIRTDGTGVLDNTSLSSRIVVAGGGGSSTRTDASAGYGGGLIGGSAQGATANYGNGGTQSAGGAQGGSFGLGGSNSAQTYATGGAGWYGGGSGVRTSGSHINGGGGSSYVDSSCTYIKHTQGYNDGAGYITIKYTVEGTSSDYDFYIDQNTYSLANKPLGNDDVFYGLDKIGKGDYISPVNLVKTFLVGTPTITSGIASGFSLSNYIQTYKPFAPESYPWELQLKFKPSYTSSYRRGCLCNDAYGDYRFPKVEITTVSNSSLKFGVRITSAGGSWTIERGQNDTTISYDYTKWIYLKIQFTGTDYITSYKLEGDADFTVISTVSSTAAIWQPADALGVTIGADISSGGWASYFDGQIDLNETYIKYDSAYWFRGDMLNGIQSI